MVKLSKIINSFICKAKSFDFEVKSPMGLISPFFEGDFNQSAGTQYVAPTLVSDKEEVVQKLAMVERCFRRSDLGKIGYSKYHLLFFEMGLVGILGFMNQYELREAFSKVLKFSFEWFRKELVLDRSKFLFTVCKEAEVFGESFHEDKESIGILRKIGIRKAQIVPIKGRGNFFYSKGENRPVGYSIEIFYEVRKKFIEIASANISKHVCKNEKLIPTKNGACAVTFGFERILCAVNSNPSIFDTELFTSLTNFLREFFPSEKSFSLCRERVHLIMELIRSITFIVAENQSPDKSGRGQILKKLLRDFFSELTFLYLPPEVVIDRAVAIICKIYKDRYPFLNQKEAQIKRRIIEWMPV